MLTEYQNQTLQDFLNADDEQFFIFHSYQSLAAVNYLTEHGLLNNFRQFTFFYDENADAMHAYDWLVEQMLLKGYQPKDLAAVQNGNLFPVWLNFNPHNSFEYRTMSPSEFNETTFLLTLKLPKKRVLLGRCDIWDSILVYAPLSDELADEIKLSERKERKLYIKHEDYPQYFQDKIKEEWQAYFDLKSDLNDPKVWLQGTTWDIQSDDIIDIKLVSSGS